MSESTLLNLYTKSRLTENDKIVIEKAIDEALIDTCDIFDDFKEWCANNESFTTEEIDNFKEEYQNLLSHEQNAKILLEKFA